MGGERGLRKREKVRQEKGGGLEQFERIGSEKEKEIPCRKKKGAIRRAFFGSHKTQRASLILGKQEKKTRQRGYRGGGASVIPTGMKKKGHTIQKGRGGEREERLSATMAGGEGKGHSRRGDAATVDR